MNRQPFSTGTQSMRYDMVSHDTPQESPTQSYQQVTVQPMPIPQKSTHANTFVHKLHK